MVSDQLLIAHVGLPANNLKELVALARKEPGKLAYGSFGIGSQPHLLYETLKVREGIDLLHVPYKGITPNLAALAAGEVVLGTGSAAVAAPLIAAGGGRGANHGPISQSAYVGGARLPLRTNVDLVCDVRTGGHAGDRA